jgi:dTDP-glucose 4,6-dehydratase
MSNYTDPVNIGNPAEMTVLEFAEEVLEIIETKSKIIFNDLPVDDPKVRRPDISRAKELLEWKPKVGLKEGLKQTVDYFINLSEQHNQK